MLPLRNNIRKVFGRHGTISTYLHRDPVIHETLFLRSIRRYKIFRTLNLVFSFVVFIPLIGSIWRFEFPYFLSYLICAVGVYATWLSEAITGAAILEEARFMTIYSIMLHVVLGTWGGFYERFSLYDSILHLNGGIWLAFLVFPFILGVELAWSRHRRPSLFWKVNIYTLSIVNLLGVLWEIGEFAADQIFAGRPGYRLAQEGNFDTMTDIILNNIGAVLGIWILWRFLGKGHERDDLLERVGRALRDFINRRQPGDREAETLLSKKPEAVRDHE